MFEIIREITGEKRAFRGETVTDGGGGDLECCRGGLVAGVVLVDNCVWLVLLQLVKAD